MPIQPYLFFQGRCEEAVEFYRGALGAQVEMLMRFKDNPDQSPGCAPGDENKVMHAALRIGDGVLMASDGMNGDGRTDFKGFALSLAASDEADARCKFDALAQGGNIVMPLGPTFYASIFGMVTDRFGVQWMVGVMKAP
jgi:PhnB protein